MNKKSNLPSEDLKVLFIVGELSAGGLETQLYYLISSLKEEGIYVKLFVINFNEKHLLIDNFIHLLGSDIIYRKGNKFLQFLRLYKICQETRPTYLVSFNGYLNFFVWSFSYLTNTKPIGAIRSSTNYIFRNGSWLKKISLFLPRTIFSNNIKSINDLNKSFKYFKPKLKYLPNRIDINRFNINKESIEFTSISIGKIKPEKRLDRLLDYCELMRERIPEFKHLHIGGGKYFESFKKQAYDRKLMDNLYFTGEVSNIGYWFSKSRIFVHFAEFEGSPNVVMEAMAAKLAVVSTDCGDVTKLIEDGNNGEIIYKYDKYQHVSRVIKLLENNKLLDDYTNKSFKIINEYDFRDYAKDFLSLLD